MFEAAKINASGKIMFENQKKEKIRE